MALFPYRQSEYRICGKRITMDKAFPAWGRQRGGGFAAKKEANPASLRSAAPSRGRGSRGHSHLQMERGAPKGRRLDGGKRDEKERERSSQVRPLREHPSAAKKEANPASLRSAAPSKGRARVDTPFFLWRRLRNGDGSILDIKPSFGDVSILFSCRLRS